MKHFVGIDLGTTNSAICVYDGDDVKILKSPEQNDVTPSAILIDRRGNKYIGQRAYDSAPSSPNNAALLFKRLMGSSTPIHFASAQIDKSPEECSAEILKVLFGYLPEEIRNSNDVGTVITVPAAFNQMQKNATVQAAHMAGIGRVALMQEPVAAVMSVMRTRKNDGTFIIYDFGGGTLDVAIAESLGGRVNLLANGGIQMCGGRDMDRAIFDNIVKPWLMDNFDLPDDFMVNAQYKRLIRYANWAIEKAKIELSSREEANISLSEVETGTRDTSGEEIYIDITISTVYDNVVERLWKTAGVSIMLDTIDKVGKGKAVTFGGMLLFNEGIEMQRDSWFSSEVKCIPWSEVRPPRSGNGALILQSKDGKFKATFDYQTEYNIHVLSAILRTVLRSPKIKTVTEAFQNEDK